MDKDKKKPFGKIAHSVSLKERRKFIRHPLCIPLKYKVIEPGSIRPGAENRSTTIDVSLGGLLFVAKRPVPERSRILINMPFQDKLFNVKAKVVHCEKNHVKDLYHIGVCFLRLYDAFKVKLIEQFYLISEFRDLRRIQLGKEVSLNDASREWIRRYSKRFRRLYG